MIYAELSGGLGNQMFIYAFARALGLSCGEGVTLIDRQDWRTGSPAHTALALGALNISPEVRFAADAGLAKRVMPVQNAAKALMIRREQRAGLMARDWQPFEARMAPLLNAVGLHFATEGFTPARRGRAKNFLAWGYFQSAEYFAGRETTIRAELTPRETPELGFGEEAAAFARRIEVSPRPVCLHWRCGDYLLPQNAALQVCTPAYYAAACRAVRARWPNAELFVFSDGPDYVRANLDAAGLPVRFAPSGSPAAVDLALMRRCGAFVLSNSTFSWWAQFLAAAPADAVFAPDRWYANNKKTALCGAGWNLIKAGDGTRTPPCSGARGENR